MSRTPRWPADPESVWAGTEEASGQAARRPPAPSWRDFDDFRVRVAVPHWSGSAFTVMFFGVVFAVGAWLRHGNPDRDRTITAVIGAVGVVLFVSGLLWLVWDRAGRERYLRRVYRRAHARGLSVHAFVSPFEIPRENSSPDPTLLLIDTRLSDETADRLQRVFNAWCERLLADRTAKQAALNTMGHRRVVALSEVFGPEAGGAWLAVKPVDDDDSPWRVLILDAKHVEISEILPLGGKR